jgi:DNA-binding transcriptional regulator GbsR (MarR family)
MDYKEAKSTLIQAWGTLGSSWGINRTMAQIHILLMITPEHLSTEDIMEQLNISRGNVNMNLRALLEWGVIYKKLRQGERKEFFTAEKDIWELAGIVSKERRKRELEPAMRILDEVSKIDEGPEKEVSELRKVSKNLLEFSEMADSMLDKFSKAEQSRLLKLILAV